MKRTSLVGVSQEVTFYEAAPPSAGIIESAARARARCDEILGDRCRNMAARFTGEAVAIARELGSGYVTLPVNNILWILASGIGDGERMQMYRDFACAVGRLFRHIGRKSASGFRLSDVPIGRTVIETLRKPMERMTGSRLGGYNMLQSLVTAMCFGLRGCGMRGDESAEAGRIVGGLHPWLDAGFLNGRWCCRFLTGGIADALRRNVSLYVTARAGNVALLLSALGPCISDRMSNHGERSVGSRGALREIMTHMLASARVSPEESVLAASLMTKVSVWEPEM